MLSTILEVRLQPFNDSFCKAVQDANNPSKTPTLALQFDKSKYLELVREWVVNSQPSFFQVYYLAQILDKIMQAVWQNNYCTLAIIARYWSETAVNYKPRILD